MAKKSKLEKANEKFEKRKQNLEEDEEKQPAPSSSENMKQAFRKNLGCGA